VLIAVAASGTTPFTLACLRGAKRERALTIGIANNPGTPILQEADHAIFLETGAEPIAGSTRMNAGTAQRITLTLLSSLLMIRLGRVYDGMMVDVQATNKKLAKRSETMLMHLTGGSEKSVRAALKESDGNVKLAVLLLQGCTLKQAKSALARSKGQLRTAIARLEKNR
jgi:N-acetylmuramic acid 6-phosphate etherase